MIMQTTLPEFFMDVLHLSYKELALALALFKGTGFAFTSPLWAKYFSRTDIFRFSALVTLAASLFPVCLFLAQWNLLWLYVGYLIYGVMQAGSEMSWNMSGPIFSKEKDSSGFSSVNIMTVGLRGCVMPAIGSVIYQASTATNVFVIGGCLCLIATELAARGVDQWPVGSLPYERVAAQVADGQWWVVRDELGLLGTMRLVWTDPDYWGEDDTPALYVHGLMVDRRATGTRLGPALVAWADARARAAGVPWLRLDHRVSNEHLDAMYRSWGFEPVRVSDRPGFAVVLMQRPCTT